MGEDTRASAAPTQIAPDWWMAIAPTGLPYFHNTKTGETTWIAPMLSTEATSAAFSTNQEEALKESESATPMTMAAQQAGLSSGVGQSAQQQEQAMQMMMKAAPPTVK